MLKKAKGRIFLLPVLIMLLGSAIAFSVFLLADYTDIETASAGNSPQWTQEIGLGASFPACGSSSNTFPTCSGGSPSLTISWTWTPNASHPRECNLTNVGIYKGGIQVQGYQRACNDSITWAGGESGTVYTYNVYFTDVDGNPPIETKSGTFTTPYCTPISVSSCSASPLTANIGEDVTWRATPQDGLAGGSLPKQEWVGNTTNGGWAAPPGGDTPILARRFQAIRDYNLKVVSLDIAKESTVTGTLWVTIESDSGGVPSGSVLPNGTSPTIAEGRVWSWSPTGWVQFYFNSAPLVSGTNYWIVLRGSLSGPGNKIIAQDTLATDPNPGSLSLIHSWGAPAWTNTGASYGYRIYAPNYTYAWHGDVPLEGQTANPAVIQYSSSGPKSGSVDVSDGVTIASASCGIVTVNPPPQPDLVIQSPSFSPGSPIVSQSVTFSGTVANTGTGAAGASQARVRVDLNNNGWTAGEPEFTNPTGALGVGGTEAESFAPWASVLGTHSYQICADKVPDPNGVVAESDEGNNCSAPQTFTVSPPPPQANLVIDSHSAVPSTVISGASVTISGTVLNIGGASAGSSNTRLRIDIGSNGSWDVTQNAATGALASSASELEQWILTVGSVGPRTYEICADSLGAVSESSEADNCVTGTYNGVSAPSQPPIAEAGISIDGVTYTNLLTVIQGTSYPNFRFSADRDVNGDSIASYDPDGWTDATNGVSSGGKCEWNVDLNSVFGVQSTVNNPASPASCNQGAFTKTFNDPPGDYTYPVLRIYDRQGFQSNTSLVTVKVTLPIVINNPPVAWAGNGHALLSGISHPHSSADASDPDGNLASYSWSWVSCPGACPALSASSGLISGGAATISGPTYTPNSAGNFTLRLIVTDTLGLSSAPSNVTESTTASPPTAEAGPYHVMTIGVSHTHTGGIASDPDNNLASYGWIVTHASCPSGVCVDTTSAISGGASPVPIPGPTFTPPAAGTYRIDLRVYDATGLSATDSISDIVPYLSTILSASTDASTWDSTSFSGTAPLNGLDLKSDVTSNVGGTGNFTFFCDKNTSNTIPIESGYVAKYDGVNLFVNWGPGTAASAQSAGVIGTVVSGGGFTIQIVGGASPQFIIQDVCSYATGGLTVYPKVVVERNILGALAAQDRVPVTVSPSGNIISFTANPSFINPGGSSDLRWTTAGFSNGQCSIDQGVGIANPAASGNKFVSPIVSTLYTLTCDNGTGPVRSSRAVNVAGSPIIKEVPPR